MKALPLKLKLEDGSYVPCSPEEATHIQLHMVGPLPDRLLPVTLGFGPCWNWNKDTEAPTLSPSVITRGSGHVCHSFIRDGVVEYLRDCTHAYAGQRANLLDVEE